MPDIRSIIDSAAEFTPAPASAPGLSDDALALRFTAKHRDDLRYVAGWGRWLEWDSQRWRFDSTLHVFDMARLVCRTASVKAEPDDQEAVASARTIAAVEKLARADRKHARTTDEWDRDPCFSKPRVAPSICAPAN
jgi:putative DNA primase/helicase